MFSLDVLWTTFLISIMTTSEDEVTFVSSGTSSTFDRCPHSFLQDNDVRHLYFYINRTLSVRLLTAR